MDPLSGGGGGDGPCPDSHRCFTAGSRQAPDPHDQFLERENYYRKHTPRDPSSLFRCISEQLFDTQHYYRRVRDECCAYMRRNREYFESHVDGCFDEYMQNMSCFRQRGTLLELRALAYRYRRNVVLFEPYTLGNSFIQQAQYGKDTFLVFVAPDYHFDTVYTRTEIEDAAYCQSLVYQTLYEDVFKLPDVGYAVERMLHDHLGTRLTAIEGESKDEDTSEVIESCEKETSSNNSKVIAVGAVNQDGRQFVFDGKRETKCILEDYRMCHFHNESFAEYLGAVQTIPEAANNKDSTTTSVVKFNRRREDSFLKVADVSCVRQLLNDGITPFPYKVAKALDPHIYRNIEFDVWSEMRKLSRSRYMYRRFISVGDKCFVRLNDAIDQQGSNPKNLHSITVKGGGDNNNNNNKKVATINSSSSAAAKVYVGYVQHIEKYTNLYHVYVEELRERLIVHGNTVRSCPAGGGVSRDFTVIGLNGGGRVFNKYHRPTWKYPPSRPGVYPSSTPGSQYAPKQFMRNVNNNNNNFRGGYSSYYHRYTYQYNNSNYYNRGSNHYNHSRRFAYYNNNNSRQQSNANSDAEEDMSLLKKRAALMDTGMNEDDDHDPFQNELLIDEKKCSGYDQDINNNNNNNSHHVNLKELLCSTYYYAESAKYFQCNDIIAMPAFITTAKKDESGGNNNNDEQRNNRENLKRNSNNKNGGEQNPSKENNNNGDFDPFDNNNNNNKLDDLDDILPTSAVDFVVHNPPLTDTNVPLLVSNNNNGDPDQFPVDNNNIVEDLDSVKLEEQYQQQQLVYEQQQQQYQVTVSEGVLLSGAGDPAMYVASGQQQQQFYANTGTGSVNAYYMPATAMDSGAGYYQPYYHRNGAVVSQAQQPPATAPYYCNYVYSNATGAMQTVTPYLLTNGGVAASGGANFNGSVYGQQQFDGQQLIPIQNAIRRRDLLYSETPVNVNSTPSYSVKGNDLPTNDVASLRFFYNLGLECFSYLASMQGAQNALNCLQSGTGEAVPGTDALLPGSTPPVTSGGMMGQSPSYPPVSTTTATTPVVTVNAIGEVSQELKGMSLDGNNNKRNHSTSSSTVNEPIGVSVVNQPTRNSTATLSTVGGDANNNNSGTTTTTANSTTSSSASTGNNAVGNNSVAGRNFQGPGYRRPPFNNNSRGGYRQNQYNNNYRVQQQQQNQQGSGPDKNKDSSNLNNNNNNRGPGSYNNNYYNNYGYAYNRRNIPGGPNRFNNNYNNPHMNNNRKPTHNVVSGGAAVTNETALNRTNNGSNDDKVQSQSPFQQSVGNLNNPQRHGQSPSPAAKGHYSDQGSGQYGAQQQPQMIGSEDSNNNTSIYGTQDQGGPGLNNNHLQSVGPMNYFGTATGIQQFPFSGPPPHLPPPFGNNTTGGNNNSQMLNPPQQLAMTVAPMTSLPQQQPGPQQLYNSPFYTYATYYPVDMGQGATGMIATGGDGTAGGNNMIIQSMPYMTAAPGSPYQSAPQNQHLMGAAGAVPQQLATPPNGPMYYTTMSGGEPGTPIMQSSQLAGQPTISWAAASSLQDTIPWSSTTGGTPGNSNSGPSSGIGSTESSPPYGSSATNNGGQTQQQGLVYASQSPAYNYSYPPPPHHQQQQQQFWYATQPQTALVGHPAVASNTGTPVAAKVDGKP